MPPFLPVLYLARSAAIVNGLAPGACSESAAPAFGRLRTRAVGTFSLISSYTTSFLLLTHDISRGYLDKRCLCDRSCRTGSFGFIFGRLRHLVHVLLPELGALLLMACVPMRPLALLPAVGSLFAACASEKGAPPRTRKLVAVRARFAVASPRLHFSPFTTPKSGALNRSEELVNNPEDDFSQKWLSLGASAR